MSSYAFNPFTSNLDIVGSGASYIDGVVADPTALPVTLGTPALDSVYLAKAGSGVWLINRRPSGLYCRVANNGNLSDWVALGAFPEVNSSANWELYDGSDPTKELKFDLSGIATGTTRTITVPDANVTLPNQGTSTTDSPSFAGLTLTSNSQLNCDALNVATSAFFIDLNPVEIEAGIPINFTGVNAATNAATTRTNLGLGDAATADIGTGSTEVAAGDHGHGNLTSDGKIGSTAGLPVVTTTAGAVTTLALGTANQVLRVNSGATGVEFADPSGGGASLMQSIAVGFVLN